MPEFPGGAWWPERRTWGIGPAVGGTPWTDHLASWTLGGVSPGPLHQALVVQAPATGAIIGFRIVVWLLQDTTSAGGPGAIRFSCQTLDPATGWPTGTGAFTVEITTDVVYAGGAGSQYEATFTEPFDVERGDLFACVWELTHRVPDYTLCTFLWTVHPRSNASPHYGLQSFDGVTWDVGGGAGALGSTCVPGVGLRYDDESLNRAADDILPMATRGRLGFSAGSTPPTIHLTLTADMDPVGVSFTVPRSLTCDACCFNFELDLAAAARITLTGPDVAVSGDLLGVAPNGVGYGYNNWPIEFDAVILRPGETYTATLQTLEGTGVPLNVKGARVDPEMLTDFEGGPTWTAFGDPADIVTRWFFFLHIPGPAEELPGAAGGGGFTVRDCVVIPVCPEEEEPGPPAVTPSLFAAWRVGEGPLQPRGRARRRG